MKLKGKKTGKLKKQNKRNRGITLIALIITVIILLILAGVVLNFAIGNNSMFNRANEAKFKTRWSSYDEAVELYKANDILHSSSFEENDINAGETLKELIEQEMEVDIEQSDVTYNMKEIVKKLEKQDEECAVVYHGELCYVLDIQRKNAKQEAEWCIEIGIPVLELQRPTGVNNKKGDYELVGNIYMCTPKLDMGFNKNYTRYVNLNDKGAMEPGNWILKYPEKDWYNYEEGKWANIVTENNGTECYYTWIPRYCYKLDQTNQRADVKLIDTANNYKDGKTDEVTPWEGEGGLKEQGYLVPEAFQFGEEESKTELPGYWVMKYNLGDNSTPSTLVYTRKINKGIMTLSNTTVTEEASAKIVKYTVSVNSKIIYEVTDPKEVADIKNKEFKLDKIKAGENIINITGLNEQGEMIGSYTSVYEITQVNEPQFDVAGQGGFNKETTFYVTYDEEGKEHSTVPITEEEPAGWYNYGESRWANIVTRNNGGEIYYTWIPRYEYYLDQTNQKSVVKFIKGTTTNHTSGYAIPEAFSFGEEGNKVELPGYWIMKYNLADTTAAKFNTELKASGNSIKTSGITIATDVDATGFVYHYYINDKPRTQDSKPHRTTKNASEVVEFTGLTRNKEYTVLVEIRKEATDEYVGSIVKQITTEEPNIPDLTGFNADCTYYVTYNGDTEVIGDKIQIEKDKNGNQTQIKNMPENWYDYGESRWANIVVEANGAKTYFTWIPRYQYRLDQDNQRSDVKFIEGVSNETKEGYVIPEAFRFGEEGEKRELSGYWVMKYNIGQ